ncbi:MAG: hypothetical protein ACHQW9_00065 [Nitrososphaerales archaeon]
MLERYTFSEYSIPIGLIMMLFSLIYGPYYLFTTTEVLMSWYTFIILSIGLLGMPIFALTNLSIPIPSKKQVTIIDGMED